LQNQRIDVQNAYNMHKGVNIMGRFHIILSLFITILSTHLLCSNAYAFRMLDICSTHDNYKECVECCVKIKLKLSSNKDTGRSFKFICQSGFQESDDLSKQKEKGYITTIILRPKDLSSIPKDTLDMMCGKSLQLNEINMFSIDDCVDSCKEKQ
jgi:hypothetical protein